MAATSAQTEDSDAPDLSPLMDALVSQDFGAATQLLSKRNLSADVNVNEAHPVDGCAPLILAAAADRLALVKRLIVLDADPTAANEERCTPLMAAAENGHVRVISELAGTAAAGTVNDADASGQTAVFLASSGGHSDAVRALVDVGADLNTPDADGMTPLLVACEGGHDSTVQLILDLGGDTSAVDHDGATALMLAVEGGSMPAFEAVISAAGDDEGLLQAVDSSGYTALHHALDRGHTDMALRLIGLGAFDSRASSASSASSSTAADEPQPPSLLCMAACSAEPAVLNALRDAGVLGDLNALDEAGMAPLHYAAESSAGAAAALLAAGASPQLKTKDGMTPIRIAAESGNADAIEALVRTGSVDINEHEEGVTPLALALAEDQPGAVTAVLDAGASLTLPGTTSPAVEMDPEMARECEACYFRGVETQRTLSGLVLPPVQFVALEAAAELAGPEAIRALVRHPTFATAHPVDLRNALLRAIKEGRYGPALELARASLPRAALRGPRFRLNLAPGHMHTGRFGEKPVIHLAFDEEAWWGHVSPLVALAEKRHIPAEEADVAKELAAELLTQCTPELDEAGETELAAARGIIDAAEEPDSWGPGEAHVLKPAFMFHDRAPLLRWRYAIERARGVPRRAPTGGAPSPAATVSSGDDKLSAGFLKALGLRLEDVKSVRARDDEAFAQLREDVGELGARVTLEVVGPFPSGGLDTPLIDALLSKRRRRGRMARICGLFLVTCATRREPLEATSVVALGAACTLRRPSASAVAREVMSLVAREPAAELAAIGERALKALREVIEFVELEDDSS